MQEWSCSSHSLLWFGRGEKGSSLLSVSSFCRRRVPGEDCDGARASRCDAIRRELKTSPSSGFADLLLAARGHMDRSSDAHAPFRLVYEL